MSCSTHQANRTPEPLPCKGIGARPAGLRMMDIIPYHNMPYNNTVYHTIIYHTIIYYTVEYHTRNHYVHAFQTSSPIPAGLILLATGSCRASGAFSFLSHSQSSPWRSGCRTGTSDLLVRTTFREVSGGC